MRKLFAKIQSKIVLGTLLILGGFFLGQGYITITEQQRQLLENLKSEGEYLSNLLAKTSITPIQTYTFYVLQEHARIIEEIPQVAFCEIYDQQGNSLIQNNIIINGQVITKKKRQVGDNIWIFEKPIISDGQNLGRVEIGFFLDSVQKEIKERTYNLWKTFIILLVVIAVILNFFLIRLFVIPVINLSKTAQTISQGKFVMTDIKERSDEIGELARNFNLMSQSLKENFEEIKEKERTLEQKVQERTAEVSKAKEQLDLALASSELAWWDWGAEHSLVTASAAYWKMIGYEPDEKRDARLIWEESIHPDDKEHVLTRIRELVKHEEIFDISYRGRDRYENALWFRLMGKAVEISEERRPIRIIGIIQDVTDEKKRELELMRSREAAEKANRAKSLFLSHMSHELRTPLNTVTGFSELLTPMVTDKKQESYLNAIKTAGKSLLNLINDILDLSKIEAGKIELEKSPVSLRIIMSEIEQLFALKASEKKLRLFFENDDQLPEALLLDETRIRQVLLNLVGNSVKFTEEGHIKISTKVTTKRNNLLDLDISVEDTGVGIPKEDQKMIFDAFTQQYGQNVNKFGGTGLGLSITRKLVELMNGTITVNSEKNVGSIFTVRLKDIESVFMETRPEEDKCYHLDGLQFEKSNVLIVDDIQSNRDLLGEVLNKLHLDFLTAQNGEEALLIAKEIEVDLIIMDLKMPVMDGYEAVKKLRDDPKLKTIPTIALTASATDKERSQVLKCGFNSFLTKPIDMNKLLRELTLYLPYIDINRGANYNSAVLQISEYETIERSEELALKLKDEIIPVFKMQQGAMVMEDIGIFAKELYNIGKEHKVESLIKFAKELEENVKLFDVSSIEKKYQTFEDELLIFISKLEGRDD